MEPPGAGAIVGVVVGVLILLLGGAFVWHRHRLRKAAEAKAAAEAQAAEAQAAEDAHPLSPIANWWGALWGGGGGGTDSLAAARASTITRERACFCIIYYKTSPSPSPDALIATKSRPLAAC